MDSAKSALKYDDEPNSFYTASLDEVIEKFYNTAADRQLPSVTMLEQSSDGTIPVKLVVSRSFLMMINFI
jgi:hypothetical protein